MTDQQQQLQELVELGHRIAALGAEAISPHDEHVRPSTEPPRQMNERGGVVLEDQRGVDTHARRRMLHLVVEDREQVAAVSIAAGEIIGGQAWPSICSGVERPEDRRLPARGLQPAPAPEFSGSTGRRAFDA